MSDARPIPQIAGRREWIGLAVIALPCLLYSMDLTVLNLALPALSADLRPTSAQLLWIVDIYGFMVAGFLIPMGTLGDRIGRRRLLLVGAAAFGIASVLAAFSRSAEMLIATRALLGIAGATVAPSTLSLIRSMFHEPTQRTVAIGVWITSYSVGGALGPLVGGVLLQYFWWGSVFLVGLPVMVLLLVVGPQLLPEYRDPNAGRPDLSSALLSLAAVLMIIYGIKAFAQDGFAWTSALSILIGLTIGAVFIRRQRRLADPLIDLKLFQSPAFDTALATYTLATFVLFGLFLYTAQHFQLVLSLSPLQAGLWTVPMMLAFIVGSNLVGPIVQRIRPETLVSAGLGLASIGFAVVTVFAASTGPLGVVLGSVVCSLGIAPVFTLSTDMIVGAAPQERAGAASAISETGSEFGGALGIALLGSVGAAVYHSVMLGQVFDGLSKDAIAAARGTLGAVVAMVEQLPEVLGSELLAASRRAFVQGFQLAAIVSTLLTLTAALVIALRLHGLRSASAKRPT